MIPEKIEDLYVRSLDMSLNPSETAKLTEWLTENSALASKLSGYNSIRETLARKNSETFGPFFVTRLLAQIENGRVIVEREIFSFFKKYQLLAAGIVVALLILNTVLSENMTVDSIFGLDSQNTVVDEIVSFDFYETLNNDL
jgi:hypothetical protein